MTDDNSPMLSQPHDDNAPMISGRGTKIIADAHGAYLAGNLRGLFNLMTEEQKEQFRLAVVGQGFYYLEQELPAIYSECLQLIKDQLNSVSSNLVNSELELLREIGAIDIEHENALGERFRADYINDDAGSILSFASAIQAGDIMGIADAVRSTPTAYRINYLGREYGGKGDDRRAGKSSFRWQVEAAWAILQRRSLPGLHNFLDGQTASLCAYRRGDFDVLIKFLSAKQKAILSDLLIQLTLTYALFAANCNAQALGKFLELREQWVVESRHGRLADAQFNLIFRLEDFNKESEVLSELQKYNSYAFYIHRFALILSSNEPSGISKWNHEITGTSSSLEWWQVEAAWTLLQGKEPPPYEALS